jgi:ABC-2 type transport system ATP-binding protein
VELTGLTIEQRKKIGALSKGYRQRVGLAQALVHNPQVLILDEPTTGLDPNQILEIRQLIKNIGREKTVIFSTHIMQEVTALCDRVVIISKGKVVADSAVAGLDQSSQRETVVVAEFEHAVDVVLLQALPGIVTVQQGQGFTYRISAAAGTDTRAAIFRTATTNNWSLVGLRQEETSLEAVFQELTKSG